MKTQLKTPFMAVFFALCVLAVFAAPAWSQEKYEALNGVDSVDTIFDFRDGDLESAPVHLQLILDTYKAQAIQDISKTPKFVVVFMDSSVKLLSSDRKEFSAGEQEQLKKLDGVISALAKEGIRLEVCLVAVNYFKVDPNTISKEIDRVGNGWISSLGYQQKGYALVPAY